MHCNELKKKLKELEISKFEKIPKYTTSKKNAVASVLVALQYNKCQKLWNVLLTKRSATLKSFPGQISFPGGNVEVGDIDEESAALRETREEIGIDDLVIEIIARLPPQVVGMKLVHSYIGIINEEIDVVPRVNLINNTEVESVFFVPIDLFLGKDQFSAVPFEIFKFEKRLTLNFPSFNVSCFGVTNINNEHNYDININAKVFGFTASICIYTAILIYDRAPSFDGPNVHIFAKTAKDVYDDLIARQKFVLEHFNMTHITEVREAKL